MPPVAAGTGAGTDAEAPNCRWIRRGRRC